MSLHVTDVQERWKKQSMSVRPRNNNRTTRFTWNDADWLGLRSASMTGDRAFAHLTSQKIVRNGNVNCTDS